MDTPNRIGLVSNGYGGWRLWSKDEPGMGGRDHPDAEYILLSEHDRIVAEKDAEIARITAERDAIAALMVERCADVAKVGWVSADYDLVGIADADMAMKLCEHIAAAIRAMKGWKE